MLDLKLSGDGKRLIVATFGRSNFMLPLLTDAIDGGGAGGSVGRHARADARHAGAASAPFTPGVAAQYEAKTTANVISTAGDATLSVSDPSPNAPGRLVNGSFSLPTPVQAKAASPAGAGRRVRPRSARTR